MILVTVLTTFAVLESFVGRHLCHGEHTLGEERSTTLSIVVVLPTTDELVGDHDQWQSREEILPGAQLALKEISETETLPDGYELEVIPVRVPFCDLTEGIIQFFEEFVPRRHRIIAVSHFCHSSVQYVSRLLMHDALKVIQISATPTQYGNTQHSILPSAELTVKAGVETMKMLDWNKVALVSNQSPNSKIAKQTFQKVAEEHGINVSLKLEIQTHDYGNILQELLNFGTKIIVSFVSPHEAIEILCSAYLHEFRLPNYAWIFMETDVSEIIEETKLICAQSREAASSALNNAIFLRSKLDTLEFHTLPSGLNYNENVETYHEELVKANVTNPRYANALHDSIWALALAVNGSLSELSKRNQSLDDNNERSGITDTLEEQLSRLTFQGMTGFLNFSRHVASRVSLVELFQIQSGQPKEIGTYDTHSDQLFLNESALGEVPTITLRKVYVLYHIGLTIILSVFILLIFALTTIAMFLFFYHRKQPAIKAASSTLSICMFVGCYFLLTSSLFHTINSGISKHESSASVRALICSLDTYLINVGSDIVLATVIAKTLRIYHIFNKFGKVGRVCSDQGLLVLILTTVFIKILMLILWTAVDINHLVDVEWYIKQSPPPHLLVRQQCQSKYMNLWIALLVGYSLILLVILFVLSIATRKIKRKYFNESRKLRSLSFVLVCHIFITWALYSLLRFIESSVLSKVVYSFNTALTALFCQLFLILPKIAPLMRHGCRRRQRHLETQPSRISLASYYQVSKTQLITESTVI